MNGNLDMAEHDAIDRLTEILQSGWLTADDIRGSPTSPTASA